MQAARARQGLLDRRRQRGLRADYEADEQRLAGEARAPTSSATSSSAASATPSPRRSSSAPASRRASPCSATSSGAVPRPPRDRVLATRYGLQGGRPRPRGSYGRMAALRGDAIVAVSLEEPQRELKTVPPEWYEVARAFFG